MMRNGKRKRKAEESPCLRWLELPDDVTASIMSRVGATEMIATAQKVCTKWRRVCKDPSLWKSIHMWNPDDLQFDHYFEQMCRQAIDRSCGGLVDIYIGGFATDDLLHHMAQRTNQLKCLRLTECWSMSDEGLSKAVAKFPLLEELDIYRGNAGEDTIAAAGRCCPLLKTFKFNQEGIRDPIYIYDDVAIKIGENMPGLRHLQLIGNELTNVGLQAILDGCPNLESLDLRNCFFIDLEGDLGKRCSKQIKNLRRPNETVSDSDFFSAEVDFGVGSLPVHHFNLTDDDDYDLSSDSSYYDDDDDDDDDDDEDDDDDDSPDQDM